jgi:hypothetical protein
VCVRAAASAAAEHARAESAQAALTARCDVLAQHLTDQCAEHVHIVAQRGVLGREIRIGTIHGAQSTKENAGGCAGVFRWPVWQASGQNL